jgi:hypothetical protein
VRVDGCVREELRDDDERRRWGGGCSVTSAPESSHSVKPARFPRSCNSSPDGDAGSHETSAKHTLAAIN